jgi:hypothetical protein
MRTNTVAAGVGGFVVALAVIGIGYLVFGGGKKPTPAPDRTGQTSPQPGAKGPSAKPDATKPDPTRPKPPAARTPVPPITAPKVAAGDLAGYIADLLRQYDELMGQQYDQPGALTLGERRRRIDEIVQALAKLGPEGVPALLDAVRREALANDTPRQTILVQALAQVPGTEATRALAEILSTAQWGVQMAVVAQLAARGAEGYQALEDRLAIEQDYRVRGAILKQIGQRGDARSMEIIARLARTDPDENVRRAAVRQLAASTDPEAVRTLEDLARSSPDVSVRQAAIQGYAQAAGERSVLFLDQTAQSDPNLHVRSVAILGLQVVGGNGSDEALRVLQRIANDQRQSADIQARARGAVAAVERQRQGGPSVGAQIRGGLRPVSGDGLKPLQPTGEEP